MESRIAAALRAEVQPVAVVLADTAPPDAMQFAPGRWACVMWLLASAARGRPAAAGRETFGCLGGGTGLGFGNRYADWPGGESCFYAFLSTGMGQTGEGRRAAEAVRPFLRPEAYQGMLRGEGYLKTPEQVRQFVEQLPIVDVPTRYVVFKPLAQVGREERPEAVVFLVDPDRLAALVVLANYGRDRNDAVAIPFAAGCQAVGILAYAEAASEQPRAVVGLMDISARRFIAGQLGHDLVSFTTPFALFEEMEGHVEGSFLERDTWRELLAMREK